MDNVMMDKFEYGRTASYAVRLTRSGEMSAFY